MSKIRLFLFALVFAFVAPAFAQDPGGAEDQEAAYTIVINERADDIVEKLGIAQMLVSISHCRSHATAYAMALGKDQAQAASPEPDSQSL